MSAFHGFSDSETFTSIPDSFFRQLMNEIDDLAALKVTLYALWRMEHTEGQLHFLRRSDFANDQVLVQGLGGENLNSVLERAVQLGGLLMAEFDSERYYFLNSPRGRAAVESIRKGDWQPVPGVPSTPPPERPNVFKLYEENIGPLTPLIADALRDAEQTYPPEWVAEAVEIAVKANKRNWRYVEAILKRWKEEGHAKKQDRRDAEKDGRRYVEGKFADFIEH